ncbi:MAG: DUF3109 family protein [Blastocatellia bacterium]|nr:DUF3109 family protein [Blastocatellia bacterium]
MEKPLLKRCDLSLCEGMCCYDGVYLQEGEERKIRDSVKNYPEFFSFLPKVYITTSNWRGLGRARKTAVKPHNYMQSDFPTHFEKTKCVFALSDARCSLQVLSEQLGEHSWSRKPKACWLHPLRLTATGLLRPPADSSEDADRIDNTYPGFVSFTLCGKHSDDGSPWPEVLKEEIEYFEKIL